MTFSAVRCSVWALFMVAASATVKLPIRRKQVVPGANTTVNGPLHFNDHWIPTGGYFLDIAVGSPPQPLEVLLDTGSSNLFVPSVAAPRCLPGNCPGGTFDESASSTFHLIDSAPDFYIRYGDGSEVYGNYSTDTVTLGDAVLPGFTLAVANDIQVSPNQENGNGAQYGILGVSFETDETNACHPGDGDGPCTGYFVRPTAVGALQNQGYIQSRSYSLYLDSLSDQKGSILFGGVDTAKFSGDLVTLATEVDHTGGAHNGTYREQNLRLTGFTANINGSSVQVLPNNGSITAILDSGAAALSVPSAVFNAVFASLPVFEASDPDAGSSNVMYCSYASSATSFTATLSEDSGKSVNINIPLREVLTPLYKGGHNSTTPYTIGGKPICNFGLSPSDDSDGITVGDPLLRSAYVFYHLDQKTISIAQPVYGTEDSNVVPVGPGPMPALTGTGISSSSPASSSVPSYPTGSPPATAGYNSTATGTGSYVGTATSTGVVQYTGAASQGGVEVRLAFAAAFAAFVV